MAILQLPLPIAANTGVTPNIKTMTVSDDLATLTTAGYLNAGNLQGYTISPNDEIHTRYNASLTDLNQGDFVVLKATISNGVITLAEDLSEGNVVLPTTVNHIATYVNTDGKIGEDASVAINEGDIQAGAASVTGGFISEPGTAGKGTLKLQATANAADHDMTITNIELSQASNFFLSDPKGPDGHIQVSNVTSDPCSNLIWVTVSFSALELQLGGSVTAYTASTSARYYIREIYFPNSSAGTAFSGGGGDRDLILSDGTSTFTTIPAASLQTPASSRWGDTAVPYPAAGAGAMLAATTAGSNLSLAYNGGSADYTAGSLALIFCLERFV